MTIEIGYNAVHMETLRSELVTLGYRPRIARITGLPHAVEPEVGATPYFNQHPENTDAALSSQSIPQESMIPAREQSDTIKLISALAMQGDPPVPAPDAWRSTIGMFADDPMMDRIIETGRRIRESERHE